MRAPVGLEPLLSIRAVRRRLRMVDVPGDESSRIGGHKPLHVKWGLAYIIEIVRELFCRRWIWRT